MKYWIYLLITLLLGGCFTQNNKQGPQKGQAEIIKKLTPLIKSKTQMELIKAGNKEGSQFISHFGGIPYFEEGEAWPVNKDSGKPLSFIMQLINTGEIHLPEEIGVLQFFYDWEEFPWETEQEGWLIKMYPKLDKSKAVVVEPDTAVFSPDFCTINFVDKQSLPDWEGLYAIDESILDLCEKINPDDSWDVLENAKTNLIGEQDYASFLGGYPVWVQYDETPENYKLLLEIESEDDANIMWGDAGSVYFFYDPDDVKDIRFFFQCY